MKLQVELPQSLIQLSKQVNLEGGQLYVVGGFVRNALLKIDKSDIDICGPLKPQKILKLCDRLGLNAEIINNKLGTVLIRDLDYAYEYTTFRKESYKKGGCHLPNEVEFVTDMYTDALRRDFTANAIYLNIQNYEITDYFNGIKDIDNRTLKAVDNPQRVFLSDGLRILRLVRLSCELNFDIDKLTFKNAKKHAHNLKDISKQRVLKELKDIVKSDSKYSMFLNQHNKGIKLLKKLNAFYYILQGHYKNVKLATNSKAYKAFIVSKTHTRYFAFVVMLLYSLMPKARTSKDVEYMVQTLLGTNGLKDSTDNKNKIIKLANFVFMIYNAKQASVDMVIKYNEFSKELKPYFTTINKTLIKKLEDKTLEYKKLNMPFKIADLQLQSSDLIKANIIPNKITKIKAILFNECLSQALDNNNKALIERAIELNSIV